MIDLFPTSISPAESIGGRANRRKVRQANRAVYHLDMPDRESMGFKVTFANGNREQEFIIGGYIPGAQGFDALLASVYDWIANLE